MLEPYQRNKIPVVFTHGLLSDPFTWAEMLNELRSRPGISERYQFWAYEYPTEQPFLASAANLRSQLKLLQQSLNPGQTDTALSQMVLVGHSMGGLIAKLQITQSQDLLWRTVSRVSSAEHPGVASTTYVSTSHTSLTSNAEVIDELAQILADHQRTCGAIWLGQLSSSATLMD